MDAETIKKMLNELYPHLEAMETQTTALLEFLTAKGIVTDLEFHPFLEEAGKTSSVKWLTTRLRIEHVLSTSAEQAEKPAEISTRPPVQKREEQPQQENESQQASDNAEEKASPARGPEQTDKSAEAGEQPEKDAA